MTHSTELTHAEHLPEEARAPDSAQQVADSIAGQTYPLAPAEAAWDSFFLGAAMPSEDFMGDRDEQVQPEHEAL